MFFNQSSLVSFIRIFHHTFQRTFQLSKKVCESRTGLPELVALI